MERYEIQKLRELPIEGVAERLGMMVVRHRTLCPFHDDHHPSMAFNLRKNNCRCFVCMNESIGTIDLVMRHLRMGFKDACRWLADGSLSLTLPNREGTYSYQKETKQVVFDPKKYERFFEHPFLGDRARAFLFDERKLDKGVVEWCRLTSWRDRQGTFWLQIPYFDVDGKLIGVQNRNLGPSPEARGLSSESLKAEPSALLWKHKRFFVAIKDTQSLTSQAEVLNLCPLKGGECAPRFRFPYGSRCSVYNLPVLKLLREGEGLWITEGCSDCWAMLSTGRKAIAIPSATLLNPQDLQLLSTLNSRLSTQYHMYPDQDEPGERLFLQLKKLLEDSSPRGGQEGALVHHQLPPGCKDFSDYYVTMKRKEVQNG